MGFRRIYLDYNAATPVDPRVLDEYNRAVAIGWANSSSLHQDGQKAKGMLAEARARIASCFSVKPKQVVFFSTATEGLNTILRGLLAPSSNASVITSVVEHSAIYDTCTILQQEGKEVVFLPVGSYGAVDPDRLREAITPATTGMAIMSVNNETGVVTDMQRVADIAFEHRIPLLVDGVAQLGKGSFQLFPGISAAIFSSMKIYAPAGVGFAIMNAGVTFRPLIFGGRQESGLRSGTENVAAIHATSIALELLLHDMHDEVLRVQGLREHFEALLFTSLPGVFINGSGPRVGNTSNLAFEGVSGEDLLIQLDLAGFSASHGAACTAGALEPSRVLLNMGYSIERAKSSVRFSFGKKTTSEDVELASSAIIQAVQKQRGV